jgi:TolB-like protein
MNNILKFLIFILVIGSINAQITLAIADFDNNSNEFYLDNWEKMIPDYLKSELASCKKMILVERQNLESVLKEQALGMTGLIDSSTAQKVGDLLGAQFIISGTVSKPGDWYRIDAKIIRVSTGEVHSEKVRSKDDQHLNEMVQLLANNIISILTREREYHEKQELKKYPTKYFLLATVGLAAGTVLINNNYQDEYDQYHAALTISDLSTKYDNANKLYKTRNVFAAVTGAALLGTIYCWLKNLSPNIIYAHHKTEKLNIMPAVVINYNNEVSIGVKVYF